MRAIVNAEKERALGNLWRAREILQGSIPNAGYDCELFETLGTILLEMGDLPEAGRFLFLSGRRKASHHDAIRIFLSKHRKNPRGLYAAFPRTAKLARRSDYPESLREDLKHLGFPDVLKGESGQTLMQPDGGSIPAIVGWAIVGSLLALLLLGVIKVIEIWSWIKKR